MKKLFLILFLAYASTAQAASYECKYTNSDSKDLIKVDIDMKTLFVQADGPSYSIAGYAFKQVSKAAGRTFLILPAGVSVPSITVEVEADGAIKDYNTSTDHLECTFSRQQPQYMKQDPRAGK